MSAVTTTEERARLVAGSVNDPELPFLTLDDLGVLRGVDVDDGRVRVRITPTYSGCPALDTMRDDLERTLREEGFGEIVVEIELAPAWSSDDISDAGRAALALHGYSPPGPAPRGPVSLTLGPPVRLVRCPNCGSTRAELSSEFGSTACKALYRCTECLEPFEHIKEI